MSRDRAAQQQAELEQIATGHEQAGTRQAATEQVQSEEALRRIAQHSRGRDKSVYRIAQRKLQELREERAQQAELHQQMEELCEQMQALAEASYSPDYSVRWQHLEKLWHERRQHMSQEQQARADAAATAIVQRERENPAGGLLHRYRELHTRAGELYGALVNEQVSSPSAAIREVAEEMQQLRDLLQDSDLLTDHMPDWNALERIQDFLQASERLERFARELPGCSSVASYNRALQTLAWPADLPEPELVLRAHEAMEEQQGVLQQQREQARSNRREAGELVQKIHAELDEGRVKSARELITRVLALELREHQKRQVEYAVKRAQRRIRELADWNRYAVEPKKDELCRQMEALSEQEAPADAEGLKRRAAAITELQNQWRDLDRGGLGSSAQLWQRFQSAGNKAWEPCGAHFAEVRQEERERAQRARELLEELHALASQPPEEIHPQMRKLMGEWKKLQPLPQSARRQLHRQMDERLKELETALAPMHQVWRRSKLQIIKKAEQLSHARKSGPGGKGGKGGKGSRSIDAVKALQADWKRIPALPREENDKLWADFRKACGQVFAQADEVRKKRRESEAESEQQAEALLSELQEVLALGDAEFLEAESRARGLLKSLDEMNLRQKPLQKKHRETAKALRTRTAKLQASQAQQHYEKLQQFSEQCGKQEQLALQGKPASLDELTPPEQLPAALAGIARERLDSADQVLQQGKKYDTAALLRELLSLTVLAEVIADAPSPDEDTALRLQIKAENMKQALEGGKSLPDGDELRARWLKSPFCGRNAEERKQLKALQARFTQALDALDT